MNICVDIDQTIASGFLGASVEESLAYYRARQVVLPPEARRYQDFFGLPEVIRLHEEIPHALNALHHLARAGHDIGYFTVRHSDDPVQQEKIRTNTRWWLVKHHFPFAEQVFFFSGMPAKLYEIGKQISQEPAMAVLIDDRWQNVLDALARLQEVDPQVAHHLVKRLRLLAFGATQNRLPTETPLQVRALPDWTHLQEVFDAIGPNSRVSPL